jgi:hypothetical protein
MWVSKWNFDLFYQDKPFVGWSGQQNPHDVLISIPKESIQSHRFAGYAIEFHCK